MASKSKLMKVENVLDILLDNSNDDIENLSPSSDSDGSSDSSEILKHKKPLNMNNSLNNNTILSCHKSSYNNNGSSKSIQIQPRQESMPFRSIGNIMIKSQINNNKIDHKSLIKQSTSLKNLKNQSSLEENSIGDEGKFTTKF
jgi:hypothetical protein